MIEDTPASPSNPGPLRSPPPPPPIHISEVAAAQPNCPDCSKSPSSQALRVITVQLDGFPVLVDVSSGMMRPLVPAPLRRGIFNSIHSLSHLGIRATKWLISSRYLWPNLATEVAQWCRDCTHYQRAKVTLQPTAPVLPIPVPTSRFTHIHVDIVGPLPAAMNGEQYNFTTRWVHTMGCSRPT
jgi:Integrase zinc binding domain